MKKIHLIKALSLVSVLAHAAEDNISHIESKPILKIFKCTHTDCIYSTSKRSDFKNHNMMHDGDRPFKCEFPGCEFAAIKLSVLRKHNMMHTGERPFKCKFPNCKFAAKTAWNLKEHSKVHTGEKPFKCDFPDCDFTTTREPYLKSHEKTHKKKKPFKCDYKDCKFASINEAGLKRHRKKHGQPQDKIPRIILKLAPENIEIEELDSSEYAELEMNKIESLEEPIYSYDLLKDEFDLDDIDESSTYESFIDIFDESEE